MILGLALFTLALTASGVARPVASAVHLTPPNADQGGGSTNGSIALRHALSETELNAQPQENAPARFSFTEHEVAEGESLGSIAEDYGVDVEYLIWNNPEVAADPDMLLIGEKMIVPGTSGIVYHVMLGDTISDIAATYDIDPAAIVAFTPNNIESPDEITEGMVLVLPGGVPPPPVVLEETAAPAPEPEPPPVPELPALVAAPTPAPAPSALAAPAGAPLPPSSAGLIWPALGPVNSGFGPRWGSFHQGIDIGVGYGVGVSAAASGQVVLAVYGDVGYGHYIIVRHDDGTETLYAHLSAIYIGLGQRVAQGEIIGAVGCTGWCTGAHLHFEVRIGGAPVNPLNYLS